LANAISADIPDIEENFAVLGKYNTLWIPAAAMTPLSTNGAEAGVYEYPTNDIMMDYLAFDTTTEEFVSFSVEMPENWDLGTVKARFKWTGASGCSAADTVEWKIQARAISDDDAIDAALGTAQVISDAVTADGDLQRTGTTPALTIGGTPAKGDLCYFKVSRNVGGTDDMAEDAWLVDVNIQYAADVEIETVWS